MKLNKIPITTLMQRLGELFEEGVDFIDIEGQSTEEDKSDRVKVTVRPEYYSDAPEIFMKLEKEDVSDFLPQINDDDDDDVNKKLTDDDIHDLI